ncbi:MAG TPA: flagellar basal body rod protein FlgC [Exilispira sp.]|nr:flagellar basal body rod protein FlgC [Exilispira sp.]
MLGAFNIASTGLSAQRLRMDVIANNIANANTTRTPEGGAYQRKMVIFRTYDESPQFLSPFTPANYDNRIGKGVKVVKIEADSSPFRLVWDPNHPDAIQSGPKKGYVMMPNVNIVKEMTDLISASRSYEANTVVINNAKQLYMKSIDLLK